jgi:hypothetical protein
LSINELYGRRLILRDLEVQNRTTVHTQFFPPKPLLTSQNFFLVRKPLYIAV